MCRAQGQIANPRLFKRSPGRWRSSLARGDFMKGCWNWVLEQSRQTVWERCHN